MTADGYGRKRLYTISNHFLLSPYLQPVDDRLCVFMRFRFPTQVTCQCLRSNQLWTRLLLIGRVYLALSQRIEDCLLNLVGMLVQAHVLQHHNATQK